jgi:hypothetical protein
MGCLQSMYLSRHDIFYRRIIDCWFRSIRPTILARVRGLPTDRQYIPRDIPPYGLQQTIGQILRMIDIELRMGRRDHMYGIFFIIENDVCDNIVHRDYVLDMLRQELFLNGYMTEWIEDEVNWIYVYFEPVDMRLYWQITSGR